MTIKGTAFRPGLLAPKIGKNYNTISKCLFELYPNGSITIIAYIENDNEQEIDVRDVVELQPDVVRNERERCVLGGSNFVSGISDFQLSFLVSLRFGDRDTEVHPPVWSSFWVLIPIG